MKLSRNILNTYLEESFSKIPSQDLIEILDQLGLAVASVTPLFDGLEQVVVAQVSSIDQHPNADRLRVCQVSTGDATHQIVCGATNFESGDFVPLSLVGALLPNGLKIEASKIRGESSSGMICSQTELGVGTDAKGIWNFSIDNVQGDLLSVIGQPIGSALGLKDDIIEIELTPNRGDCLSYLGVARELSAKLGLSLHTPIECQDSKFEKPLKNMAISISEELVPTFLLQVLETPCSPDWQTPFWMRWALQSHGISSIHPLVDVGNWVMLECGQPIHVYDVQKIAGTLTVREGKAGETGQTLMGEPLELKGGEIVIADDQKLLCVGGVIGMQAAEVDAQTHQVWIEAAHFEPVAIRKASKGIVTESAYRFARGVDPTSPDRALARYFYYLKSLFGVEETAHVTALRHAHPEPAVVETSYGAIGNLVRGPESSEMQKILTDLQFGLEAGEGDAIRVQVPPYRFDVAYSADLAEEVARSYGYDRILDEQTVQSRIFQPTHWRGVSTHKRKFRLADRLVSLGYQENVHVGFLDQSEWRDALVPWISENMWAELSNPLNKKRRFMPPMLFPLVFERFCWLRDRQMPVVKLFETGKVFRKDNDQYQEESHLAMLVSKSNHRTESHFEHPVWEDSGGIENSDALWMGAHIQGLVEELGWVQSQISLKLIEQGSPFFHPLQSYEILLEEMTIGFLAQVHPNHGTMRKAKRLSCFVAELFLDPLMTPKSDLSVLQAPSTFPSVTRDVSLVINEGSYGALMAEVDRILPESCVSHQLVDRFVDESGQVSVTFRMTYEDGARSLSDEEVNQWQEHFRVLLKGQYPLEYK